MEMREKIAKLKYEIIELRWCWTPPNSYISYECQSDWEKWYKYDPKVCSRHPSEIIKKHTKYFQDICYFEKEKWNIVPYFEEIFDNGTKILLDEIEQNGYLYDISKAKNGYFMQIYPSVINLSDVISPVISKTLLLAICEIYCEYKKHKKK